LSNLRNPSQLLGTVRAKSRSTNHNAVCSLYVCAELMCITLLVSNIPLITSNYVQIKHRTIVHLFLPSPNKERDLQQTKHMPHNPSKGKNPLWGRHYASCSLLVLPR
jgi:hypothetical protein